MKKKHHDFLIPFFTFLVDIFAFEISFLVSYWTRFYSDFTKIFPITEGLPEIKSYLVSSLFFIPIWIYILINRGMYKTRRNTHISDEFFPIIKSLSIGMVFILSTTFFYRDFSFSRIVFVLLLIYSILFVLIGRFISISFEKFLYKKGYELKKVIIVGATDTANKIIKMIIENRSLGLKLEGQFDENLVSNNFYKGTISDITNFINQKNIDSIIIALPYQDHPKLIDLVKKIEGQNIEILFVPDLIDLMTNRVRTIEIEGVPFLKIKDTSITFWNRFLKRSFDVVFSLTILILTFPLILLIILLIKLTSNGKVFYHQTRLSVDGSEFEIFKFRSMTFNAEESNGPKITKPGDMRVTAIGKFLRRTSLDELPQLINVLRGEMSIVGPRPERPFFVNQFKFEIPRYLERHRVKSGMTGWAQVNGMRGDVPISERTKYDIYYVENWSIAFDLKIIFKTIYSVIFAKDAY